MISESITLSTIIYNFFSEGELLVREREDWIVGGAGAY